jgi:DNA-binding response OmpR family regulator
MGRSVLLVEDDARVRRVLKLALDDEGYGVREAATAEEGLRLVETMHPDVILLDLMLPDMDGFTVCRRIRRTSDVPVIMVTARTDSHDVVAGLEAGADDYVTKPLVAKELAARIRALLRRADIAPNTGPSLVIAGDLEIGLESRVVMRGGSPVDLTRTEFRLLAELASTEGVVSREELLEAVWGYGYFGDSRIVDVHVRRLRLKVERDPASPQRVVTVRGLGYRLAR